MGYREGQRRLQGLPHIPADLAQMLGKAAPVAAPREQPKGKFFHLWPVSIEYTGQPARIRMERVVTARPIEGVNQFLDVVEQVAASIQRRDGAPEPPIVIPLFQFAEFVPQEMLDAEAKAMEEAKKVAAERKLEPTAPSVVEPGTVDGPPTPDLQPIDPASPEASAPVSDTSPLVDVDFAACAGCDAEISLEQAEATGGLCPGCKATVESPGPALVTE